MARLKIINSINEFEIDDEDLSFLLSVGDKFYEKQGKSGTKSIYVSSKYGNRIYQIGRVILRELKDNGLDVDHKDHNHLNNKKLNLRFATVCQNQQHKRKPRISNVTSKYKNVYRRTGTNKFRVAVTANGIKISGGTFDDEILAAIKADDLMLQLHGEFSCLNFPLYGA